MGTPLPPIVIDPGNDCNQCWGDGKPYTLPTPKFVQMQFHDWTEGSAWDDIYREELSSIMVLEQQPGFPCTWAALGDRFGWLLIYHPNFTEGNIALSPFGTPFAFRAGPVDLCLKVLQNELAEPPNRVTIGGYVEVTFGGPL